MKKKIKAKKRKLTFEEQIEKSDKELTDKLNSISIGE